MDLPALPVVEILPQLKSALSKGHAVLTAPPGSGKTTAVPLALLDEAWLAGSSILLLEPRRIAVRAAANRMSELLGTKTGELVGYRTRFESCISTASRIEVITEGIITRRLHTDPELKGVGLIIFDEFHERSMQADLGLALSYDLCQLRPELRLLVMSATLETESVSKLLGNAEVISGSGRLHPVDIRYLPPGHPNQSLAVQTVRAIRHACQLHTGNILAFLPGVGEIHQCLHMSHDLPPDTEILPLHGTLSHQDQDRVFHKSTGKRRIVLATPVAETSITLEGISVVIDSGFCRRPVYSASNGLSALRLVRIARDSADQRAGRAGRLGPGFCYRLWGRETDFSLAEYTPPEILRLDLTSLVLELALWGIRDPNQLAWLDCPRPSSWQSAVDMLRLLGLLDSNNRISATGRDAVQLPMHPRLAAMLLEAQKLGLTYTAALVVACLEERDIMNRSQTADLCERLQMLDTIRKNPNTLPAGADRNLCQRQLQLVRQCCTSVDPKARMALELKSVGNLLAYAYPDRIAMLRAGSGTSYQMANGTGAELQSSDHLRGSDFLVIAQLDDRSRNGRIFLAAPLAREDLFHSHARLLVHHSSVYWDDTMQRVQARKEDLVQQLVVSSTPVAAEQDDILDVFIEGVKRNLHLLNWTEDVRTLQARMELLRRTDPKEWPNWSDAELKEHLDWLEPYCLGMVSLQQARNLSVKDILLATLSWEQQQQLERLAPLRIAVPSGSSIRISYSSGQEPVLAVRLQEMFGLHETPKICIGQVPLLIHLLSPAGRPLQITGDLHSFWRVTYPEVRKELAGRYPKHYWPEDPFTAQPTRGTKKSMLARNS